MSHSRTWIIPAAVLIVWGVLVLAQWWLTGGDEAAGPTCVFKKVTGYPCATCGSTRMVMSAAQGRILDSFLYNPLMFIIISIAAMVLIARLLGAPDPLARLSHRQQTTGWIVLGVAALVNWAYLIWVGM